MKKFLVELEAESIDTIEDMIRLWKNNNTNQSIFGKLGCNSIKEGQQFTEEISKEFQTIKENLTR